MINKRDSKEIDLIVYWHVIVKRKWVIFSFTGALVFFTALFTFLATPMYESSATIQIDEELSKVLSLEEAFGFQAQARDLRFFNTQLRLIKSKSLAQRVADKMNLLSRPEYAANKNNRKSLKRTVMHLVTLRWLRSKDKTEEENRSRPLRFSNPYSDIAHSIRKKIEVKPIRETKLVEVSYTSPSPVLAADLVNTLCGEFIDFSVEKRSEHTQEASDFLSEQIGILRLELEARERELLTYSEEKEMDLLSDTESASLNKFQDLSEALTQAQIDRYRAQAEYQELKNLAVDSIPQSVTNPALQQIRTEYISTKSEYDRKREVYGENYPEMTQIRAKLNSLQKELKGVVDDAYSNYSAALRRENYLRTSVENQRTEVARRGSDVILYNSLKIEVENKRNLLNSLVERQTETQVSAKLDGFRTSGISIIDKAEIPKYPVFPNKRLNLFLALVLGITGGVSLCVLIEYLDNTLKGTEDLEQIYGFSALGSIPHLSANGMKKSSYYSSYRYGQGSDLNKAEERLPELSEIELINHHYPQMSLAEDYRTIRTSLLLSHADKPPKVIVFTSSMAQEGKTSTVANMAVSFAQLDQRVLVIDADMRKPRLHKVFDMDDSTGLSGYLTGKVFIRNAIQQTPLNNIWILPSGLIPPNPAELLNSKKMEELIEVVKKGYDVVLIDTPPVLAVIDAVIVSRVADSTVFVVKAGKITYKMFDKAVDEMKRANSHILGVLFNGMKSGKGEYRYMDYYQSREYSYESSEDYKEDTEA